MERGRNFLSMSLRETAFWPRTDSTTDPRREDHSECISGGLSGESESQLGCSGFHSKVFTIQQGGPSRRREFVQPWALQAGPQSNTGTAVICFRCCSSIIIYLFPFLFFIIRVYIWVNWYMLSVKRLCVRSALANPFFSEHFPSSMLNYLCSSLGSLFYVEDLRTLFRSDSGLWKLREIEYIVWFRTVSTPIFGVIRCFFAVILMFMSNRKLFFRTKRVLTINKPIRTS